MTATGFTSLLRLAMDSLVLLQGKFTQKSHQGMKPVQIHYTLEGIHNFQASPEGESVDMLFAFLLFINTFSHLEVSSPANLANMCSWK